jgi:hypothetical protein
MWKEIKYIRWKLDFVAEWVREKLMLLSETTRTKQACDFEQL